MLYENGTWSKREVSLEYSEKQFQVYEKLEKNTGIWGKRSLASWRRKIMSKDVLGRYAWTITQQMTSDAFPLDKVTKDQGPTQSFC